MKTIKNFNSFVSESLFSLKLLRAYGAGGRYISLPDIEYEGFVIPSWRNTITDEIWYGTPHLKGTSKKKWEDFFLYKQERLEELKKVIDNLVNDSLMTKTPQSGPSEVDLPDYTDVFPKWDKKESYSQMKN